MRLSVDPWDPSYGTSADENATDSDAAIDLEVERSAPDWGPIAGRPPAPGSRPCVTFVDGVRRVEARVWIEGDDDAEPGLAASWAAGAVVCDGRAEIAAVEVGRGLFTASPLATDLVTPHGTYRRRPAHSAGAEQLSLALQVCMTQSEVVVAHEARAAGEGLLVVDGPLRGRQTLTDAVGLVKTHHTHYLAGEQRALIGRLAPGERTPVFRIASSWIRHSWYLRLPGGGRGPMAGIVRCECAAELVTAAAVALADATAGLLPGFASEAHKDARAPQNLYPIGGLERQLRHRLGDARLLYRALCVAAA